MDLIQIKVGNSQ